MHQRRKSIMIKNILCGLCIVQTSFILSAQTTQKGLITEQNSNHSPIPGVELIVLDAQPTDSDNNGRFVLSFSEKEEGDYITVVELKKNGYELVNDREVYENWVITSNETDLFPIVMCREGTLMQNRLRYYKIAEEEISRSYREKVADLQKQLSETLISEESYRNLARELGNQLRNQQRQIDELADRFARTNFDNVMPAVQKAFDLFQAGNIAGAIQILESEFLEDKLDKLNEEARKVTEEKANLLAYEQKIENQKKEYVRALIDKAGYYKLNFQFNEASAAYEVAAMADTNNFEPLFTWARFLDEQNELDKAFGIYYKAISAAGNNQVQKAKCYNYLGLISMYKRDFEKAEMFLNDALKIRKTLPVEEVPVYKNDLASTLHNLGELFFRTGKIDTALVMYSRSCKLSEQIIKKSSRFEMEYAKTLNSFGNALLNLNDYPGAEENLKKTIDIYEKLFKEGEAGVERLLAMSLTNLGIVYNDLNNFTASKECYNKSLIIKERMVKLNPSVYEVDLVYSYANAGRLYYDMNDFEKSAHFYQKAVNILERLVCKDPETYEPDLAVTFSNYGMLLTDEEKLDEAVTVLTKAESIFDKYANNHYYDPDMALNWNLTGNALLLQEDFDKAEYYYQKVLSLYRSLSNESHEVYDLKVVETLTNIACLYYDQKDNPGGKSKLRKGLKVLRESEEILKDYPDSYPWKESKERTKEVIKMYREVMK